MTRKAAQNPQVGTSERHGNTSIEAVHPQTRHQPPDSPPTQGLSGDAHRRFVIVTTLLSLIDPVRGEPTVHSLDAHPHDGAWKHEQLQKKFLDSFALICSTSRKGAETASAVCLEQGHPDGSVLRLARNLRTPDDLVARLHEVLEDLAGVASREKSVKDTEPRIMFKIITLTQDKIRALLETLRRPETNLRITAAVSQVVDNGASLSGEPDEGGFRQWIVNLPVLASLDPLSDLSTLAPHIKWASQARWIYSEQIEAMLGPEEEELPHWLRCIYKLGRYHAAAKAMLKLAFKHPNIFSSIRVEVIRAPDPESFSLGGDKTALFQVLKRLIKTNPDELVKQLGRIWLTDDPEERLRKACKMKLTVHAEMQLLSFYDHNPSLTPRLLFMGTSKKACYLCHEFISRHPLTIGVSASHQKLYPT
ncbi:hypothetical protein EV126DRAFT_173504 [Verticillium dahliae]|nr:hypothetical protein EV126DRAFT_173504 [Verticillium dahliae]